MKGGGQGSNSGPLESECKVPVKQNGKNVLHPNVGFMWEIIDHMWDDPTFLCGMIPHSLIIILGVEISEERNV